MKPTKEQPRAANNITLGLRYVAHEIGSTTRKTRQCLEEIGCVPDERGEFTLLDLLKAIRVNADPVRGRRALVDGLKQSVAKAFGTAGRARPAS